MRKLLNIDANAKTVKGQKAGFMTAVLYLAPFKASGINVCPMAELAGCWRGCLNTAGRGGISKGSVTMSTPAGDLPDNTIQRARIARTQFYANDRNGFMLQLVREIAAFTRKAKRKGLTPVVRLNGTSDIQWERIPVTVTILDQERTFDNIFQLFADLTFYDYTKIAKRLERTLPRNYHLSLSFSQANSKYMETCLAARNRGASLVVVVRDAATKTRYLESGWWMGMRTIDGDSNDLRFLDPENVAVILKAKGKARSDTSGFVVD